MEGVVRLMGQVTTMNGCLNAMNGCLDAHDRRLTRLETKLSLSPFQSAACNRFLINQVAAGLPIVGQGGDPYTTSTGSDRHGCGSPFAHPYHHHRSHLSNFHARSNQLRSISDFSINKETAACKGSDVAWMHVSVQPKKETAHKITRENQGGRGLHACIHADTTFHACNFSVEKKKGTDMLFPCTRKCMLWCPHSPGVKSLCMLMDEQIKETIYVLKATRRGEAINPLPAA
jgi:hypothetical protein